MTGTPNDRLITHMLRLLTVVALSLIGLPVAHAAQGALAAGVHIRPNEWPSLEPGKSGITRLEDVLKLDLCKASVLVEAVLGVCGTDAEIVARKPGLFCPSNNWTKFYQVDGHRKTAAMQGEF